MPYLPVRKNKNGKLYTILAVVVIILIFVLFKFNVLSKFGSLLQSASLPVWESRIAIENSLEPALTSKGSLFAENEKLKAQISEIEAKMQNYQTLLDENMSLKEVFGRRMGGDQLLAVILVKPGQSLYDTLIVDAGENLGIIVGQKVFALGNILIGEVAEVYAKTSKVRLYSSAGEKLSVIISGKDITTDATGRGGGNFEMIFPRDIEIPKGTEIVIPGIMPYLVGIVDEVISDPRDPLQKVILRSPVNVQELKFVQIEK